MSRRRRRYALDGSVRRLEGGRVLVGGSPLKLLRLSDAGAAMVDRLVAGEPTAGNALIDRLLDGGALHPVVGDADDAVAVPFAPSDVTVVIPSFGTPVDALVEALAAQLPGLAGIVVVDDGSTPPLAVPSGVELVRRDANGGPAAARAAGLARVATPLVLFVDADVRLPDAGGAWAAALLGHFVDDKVALVAPRVASDPAPDGAAPVAAAIARYELARGPLDLGAAPGPVRARTRISYVPSALWLARTEVVRGLGGFDEAMRTGEDVDLVWRLDEAGWRARYEPTAVAGHAPRATLAGFVRQRLGYGASAGPLARRHPGALAPVGVSAWSAAAWGLAALGPVGVVAGVAVGAGSAAALARKLPGLTRPMDEAMRLAGRGHLYAGRQLASAVARPWWPLAVLAALVSRRARRAVTVAVLVPAIIDWYRTRAAHGLDPLRYLGLRVLDDAAYGAGVWLGAVRAGTVAPLVPDLTSWPRPSRYEQRPRPAAGS